MIEQRRGDLVESVLGREDDDKIGHNRIDGGDLAEGQRNCGGVVAFLVRCSPGDRGADGDEYGLL